MNVSYDYLFKFVVLGDDEIGKSILINSFTEGIPSVREELHGVRSRTVVATSVKSTGNESVATASCVSGELTIKNAISELKPIPHHCADPRYRGTNAFLVCFNVNTDYLPTLLKWVNELKERGYDDSQIFVIGLDSTGESKDFWQHRQVVREKFGDLIGKRYFQTPLNDTGVIENIFKNINKYILSKLSEECSQIPAKVKFEPSESNVSKYPLPKLIPNFFSEINLEMASILSNLEQGDSSTVTLSTGQTVIFNLPEARYTRFDVSFKQMAEMVRKGDYKLYDYDPHFSEGPEDGIYVLSLRDSSILGR